MRPLAELPKTARWEFGRPDPQLLPRITLGTMWYSRSGIGPDWAVSPYCRDLGHVEHPSHRHAALVGWPDLDVDVWMRCNKRLPFLASPLIYILVHQLTLS